MRSTVDTLILKEVAWVFLTIHKHKPYLCGKNLYLIPDELSYDDAVLIEPLSVSTHGKNRAGVTPEEKVLVCGSGPIGLGVVSALMAQRNRTVAVVDRDKHRLGCAQNMGAHPILSESDDLEQMEAAMVDYFGLQGNMNHRVHVGEGGKVEVAENPVLDVDVVFDCAGVPAFVDAFLRHAKQYSRLCNIAIHRTTTPIRFHEVMSTQCILMGSRGYDQSDRKKSNATELISCHVPLAQAKQPFELAADGSQSIKILLNMESQPGAVTPKYYFVLGFDRSTQTARSVCPIGQPTALSLWCAFQRTCHYI